MRNKKLFVLLGLVIFFFHDINELFEEMFFLPLAFLIGTNLPSSVTCSTGLTFNSDPKSAAVPDNLPPRFKVPKSSTGK